MIFCLCCYHYGIRIYLPQALQRVRIFPVCGSFLYLGVGDRFTEIAPTSSHTCPFALACLTTCVALQISQLNGLFPFRLFRPLLFEDTSASLSGKVHQIETQHLV